MGVHEVLELVDGSGVFSNDSVDVVVLYVDLGLEHLDSGPDESL